MRATHAAVDEERANGQGMRGMVGTRDVLTSSPARAGGPHGELRVAARRADAATEPNRGGWKGSPSESDSDSNSDGPPGKRHGGGGYHLSESGCRLGLRSGRPSTRRRRRPAAAELGFRRARAHFRPVAGSRRSRAPPRSVEKGPGPGGPRGRCRPGSRTGLGVELCVRSEGGRQGTGRRPGWAAARPPPGATPPRLPGPLWLPTTPKS